MDDLMPMDKPRGIEAVIAACRMDYNAGYRVFKLKFLASGWCISQALALAPQRRKEQYKGDHFP